MKRLLLPLCIMSLFNISSAQMIQTDSLSKDKIQKLDFIVGNWEGSGFMMTRDGKSDFTQTEKIEYKLDSTAILIEGKGMSDGISVHNAMAIITYDKENNNYSFRSYLPNGQNAAFKAELLDNKLYWYPTANVRYIIWLNEKGQWYETGEYKMNENWSQFFEMTLDKID